MEAKVLTLLWDPRRENFDPAMLVEFVSWDCSYRSEPNYVLPTVLLWNWSLLGDLVETLEELMHFVSYAITAPVEINSVHAFLRGPGKATLYHFSAQ